MVSSPNTNYLADGFLLPVRLAGDVALELCNTYAGWDEDSGREYLASYGHLLTWARECGLVSGPAAAELTALSTREPAEAQRVLERARRLRRAFYAVATEEPDASARSTVAAAVERALRRARLTWEPTRARLALPIDLELPVLAAAQEMARFVTSPPHVGRCPGHGCGWLFVRGRGRRRWCSMAVCGNRAKVRRHAERRRATT